MIYHVTCLSSDNMLYPRSLQIWLNHNSMKILSLLLSIMVLLMIQGEG